MYSSWQPIPKAEREGAVPRCQMFTRKSNLKFFNAAVIFAMTLGNIGKSTPDTPNFVSALISCLQRKAFKCAAR